MSALAHLSMDAARAGRLGIGVALAAAEAIRAEARLSAGVNWPNDVVVGEKKVGGVLVETQTVRGAIRAAVLSLGLNVNVAIEDLPEPARKNATSLQRESGEEHSIERLLASVLTEIERLWPAVTAPAPAGDGGRLTAMWRERDLLAGREITVETGGETLTGTAIGIDEVGDLVLMIEGERRAIQAGEATLASV
jgi:BirA family biotin operon repressor/biotin-[acetyl-CoA-carboxylase] ligase